MRKKVKKRTSIDDRISDQTNIIMTEVVKLAMTVRNYIYELERRKAEDVFLGRASPKKKKTRTKV